MVRSKRAKRAAAEASAVDSEEEENQESPKGMDVEGPPPEDVDGTEAIMKRMISNSGGMKAVVKSIYDIG